MIGVVGRGESGELVGVCHPVKLAAVDDRAAYSCVVTVHIFGCRMGDDISPPLDGSAVNRRRKCIVDDQRNAVRMRRIGEALDIKYDKGGIGNGLAKNGLGVGLKCVFQFFIAAVRIDKSEIDAHLAHGDIEQIERAAVDGGGAYNVIAASGNVKDAEEVGSLSGGSQHAGGSALQRADFGCDHIVGGILQTCIKITFRFKIEQFAHIFAGIVFKSGTLNDRNHSGFSILGRVSGLNAHSFSFHFQLPPILGSFLRQIHFLYLILKDVAWYGK